MSDWEWAILLAAVVLATLGILGLLRAYVAPSNPTLGAALGVG
jgi:hypothetical protein